MARKKPDITEGSSFANYETFCRAFCELPPGGSLPYFVGFLACARDKDEDIKAIGAAAMQFEQEGRAELTQVRLFRRCWEYRIMKRRQVNEEGRCHWESFNTHTRSGDRRSIPVKKVSTYLAEDRAAFLRHNPHLSPLDIAEVEPRLNKPARNLRPSYSN